MPWAAGRARRPSERRRRRAARARLALYTPADDLARCSGSLGIPFARFAGTVSPRPRAATHKRHRTRPTHDAGRDAAGRAHRLGRGPSWSAPPPLLSARNDGEFRPALPHRKWPETTAGVAEASRFRPSTDGYAARHHSWPCAASLPHCAADHQSPLCSPLLSPCGTPVSCFAAPGQARRSAAVPDSRWQALPTHALTSGRKCWPSSTHCPRVHVSAGDPHPRADARCRPAPWMEPIQRSDCGSLLRAHSDARAASDRDGMLGRPALPGRAQRVHRQRGAACGAHPLPPRDGTVRRASLGGRLLLRGRRATRRRDAPLALAPRGGLPAQAPPRRRGTSQGCGRHVYAAPKPRRPSPPPHARRPTRAPRELHARSTRDPREIQARYTRDTREPHDAPHAPRLTPRWCCARQTCGSCRQ